MSHRLRFYRDPEVHGALKAPAVAWRLLDLQRPTRLDVSPTRHGASDQPWGPGRCKGGSGCNHEPECEEPCEIGSPVHDCSSKSSRHAVVPLDRYMVVLAWRDGRLAFRSFFRSLEWNIARRIGGLFAGIVWRFTIGVFLHGTTRIRRSVRGVLNDESCTFEKLIL